MALDTLTTDEHQLSPAPPPPGYVRSLSASNTKTGIPTPPHSRSSLESKVQRSSPILGGPSRSLSRNSVPTPLRVQALERRKQDSDEEDLDDLANENSLVLHHSDDEDEISPRSILSPISPNSHSGKSTADKAGVILGIHNVFVVLPQFLVTGLSAVIFSIMEPDTKRGIPGTHPNADLGPGASVTGEALEGLIKRAEGVVEGGSPDAVGLIFR